MGSDGTLIPCAIGTGRMFSSWSEGDREGLGGWFATNMKKPENNYQSCAQAGLHMCAHMHVCTHMHRDIHAGTDTSGLLRWPMSAVLGSSTSKGRMGALH